MNSDVSDYDDDEDDESPYARIESESDQNPRGRPNRGQATEVNTEGCGICCMSLAGLFAIIMTIPVLIMAIPVVLYGVGFVLAVLLTIAILGLLVSPFVDTSNGTEQ